MSGEPGEPGNLPITIYRGDDFIYPFIRQEDGDLTVISGYSYSAQIRAFRDSTSVLATFSCSVTSASTGEFLVSLSHSSTSSMTPGKYVWDLQETNADGEITTLVTGQATVMGDVTR